MAKVSPYHTDSPEYPPTHRNVYHDHDDCLAGITAFMRFANPAITTYFERAQAAGVMFFPVEDSGEAFEAR